MKQMIIALMVFGGFAAQAADIVCQYQVGTKKLGDSGVKYFNMTFGSDGTAEVLSKDVNGYNIFAWCTQKMICELAITNNQTQSVVKVQELPLNKGQSTPISMTETDAVALLGCEKQ